MRDSASPLSSRVSSSWCWSTRGGDEFLDVRRPLGVTRRVVCALCPSCCPPLWPQISWFRWGGSRATDPLTSHANQLGTQHIFKSEMATQLHPKKPSNPPPEAFEKLPWISSQKHAQKGFQFDPLDLRKNCVRGLKICSFLIFRKGPQMTLRMPSVWIPLGSKNRPKVVSGKDHAIRQKYVPQSAPRGS